MNYIVISPYYPQNFQQFTIELANKGITVLGIGQEPYEQLDEPLRNSLTEYFRVENLENLDEVKRTDSCMIRIATYLRIHRETALRYHKYQKLFPSSPAVICQILFSLISVLYPYIWKSPPDIFFQGH